MITAVATAGIIKDTGDLACVILVVGVVIVEIIAAIRGDL